MEKLCKELDDTKDRMEKLAAENQLNTMLTASLRKAHDEQVIKTKEAKSVIEKQEQELNAKAEEISATRQMYEDVKSKLHEKESALRHLSIANDKLRADSSEKLQKMGEENRELLFALDEANNRIGDQEMKINAFKEEIRGLKGLVSVTQKKCLEAEEKANAVKELRQRDDILMRVEEEYSKIKDQLKWKKEQFKHLEEAHEKVQDQFRVSKKEWEKEKTNLLDEICSLQTNLDSQTRIAEGLQHQLQICNQALAHEESRRKMLEFQISESKIHYENVCSEYQEAKSKIESLTGRRDEEIAELRNLLGTKESLFKESEFRRELLERENQDLLKSLKELQEAHIQVSGNASLMPKLRSKLKGLEQVHKECPAILKAREAEWSCKMESLNRDLNECRSELDRKDECLGELKMDLEACHSSILQLKLENLEISVMLTVFRCEVSDAQSNLSLSDMGSQKKEEQISLLKAQLEQKDNDLVKAYDVIEQERNVAASLARKIESLDSVEQKYCLTQKELQRYKELFEEDGGNMKKQLKQKEKSLVEAYNVIEQERNAAASLARKIESLGSIEEEYSLTQKELERYKELFEESNAQKLHLEENALQMENALKEDLRKVSDELDRLKSELAKKTNEASEIEFALNKELRKVSNELDRMNSELAKKINEANEVELALKEDLRHVSDELDRLHTELAEKTNEASEVEYGLKEDLRKVSDELDRLKSQLAEKTNEASETEFALREDLRKVSDELDRMNSELVKKTNGANETESALKEDLRKVFDELDRLNSELVEKTNEARESESTLKEELRNVSDELDRLKSELAVKTKASEIEFALNKELRKVSNELDRMNSELAKKINEANEVELALKEDLRHVSDELDRLHTELAEKTNEASEVEYGLKEDLRKVSDELDRLKSQLAEKTNEASETEFALREDLRKVSDELDRMNSELVKKTNGANETESALKEDLRKVFDELDRLNSELVEKTNEARESESTLKEELRNVSDELDRLKSELAVKTNEASENEFTLKEELRKFSDELDKLKLELAEKTSEASEVEFALKEELRKVSDELDRLKSELAEKTSEASEVEFALKEDLRNVSGELARLNSELTEKTFEASEVEYALEKDLRNISDELDKLNCELAEKTNEISEIEFELDRWKCAAENLKSCIDENHEFRREMEASLLAQAETEQSLKQIVEDKDKQVCDLKQQIIMLEQELLRRDTDMAVREGMEKESLLQIVEKEKNMKNLKQLVDLMYEECLRKEFEAAILSRMEADRTIEQERERLLQVVAEKDHIISDLQLQTMLLEQDCTMEIKVHTMHEAWQKVATAVVLNELEVQERNLMIVELEEDITSLQQKLELQESSLCHLKQREECHAEMEAKQLEMQKEIDQCGSKLSTEEGRVEKLEFQKELLVRDMMKMSSERGELLILIEGLYDQISEFSNKDVELMARMGGLMQSFVSNNDHLKGHEYYVADRENISTPLSLSMKKVEARVGVRSLLKELNN